MQKLPKHILVIRLSAMGDVAMTVPIIRALNNEYPEVKITILTKSFFKPFFKGLNNVSVYEADVKGKHKGILGLWKLSKELKRLDVDAVADLHDVLRSNILKFFFIGKKFAQIDKGRNEKKALVSGGIFEQLKTTHERYIEVFEDLGFKLDMSNPKFPEIIKLNDKLKQLTGEKQTKWIGIAPFAAYKSKMFPLDKMLEVIELLSKDYKLLLFGGGDNEIRYLEPIESAYKNVINLAGKLSLDEELDVISNLNVMVSMDSGNGHLAAMLGVPVLTIWGATHPFAGFTPFNQPKDYQLLADREQYPKIPTSVYGNKFPETYEGAAGSIPTVTIIEKIKEIL